MMKEGYSPENTVLPASKNKTPQWLEFEFFQGIYSRFHLKKYILIFII